MIKNQAVLHAVSSSIIAPAAAVPAAGFLLARQHVTQLTSLDMAGSARYVWRKVFVRTKKVV